MRRAGALSRSWAFKISPVSFICLSLLSYTFVSSHDEHYEPIFHDHIGTSSQTLLQTPPAVFCQCWSTAAQPPFSRPAIQQQEVNSSNYYSHRHSRLRQRQKTNVPITGMSAVLTQTAKTNSLCTMVTHHCVCIYSLQTASTSMHSLQDKSFFGSRSH